MRACSFVCFCIVLSDFLCLNSVIIWQLFTLASSSFSRNPLCVLPYSPSNFPSCLTILCPPVRFVSLSVEKLNFGCILFLNRPRFQTFSHSYFHTLPSPKGRLFFFKAKYLIFIAMLFLICHRYVSLVLKHRHKNISLFSKTFLLLNVSNISNMLKPNFYNLWFPSPSPL